MRTPPHAALPPPQEPAGIPRLAPKSMCASPPQRPKPGQAFGGDGDLVIARGRKARSQSRPKALMLVKAYAHERTCPGKRVHAASVRATVMSVSLWLFLPSSDSLSRACNTSGLPNCSCLLVLLSTSLSRPQRGQMEPVEREREREGSIPAPLPARALRHTSPLHSLLTMPSAACSQMKHPESNGNIAHTRPRGNTQMNKHAQT